MSILEARGHQVLAIATTASDSIAAVTANRPDACLLDLRFPADSGLDVARALRLSVPETKIVVFSCATGPEVVAEAKKIGVVGFLRKDQRPETIMSALKVISVGEVGLRREVLVPAKSAHDVLIDRGTAPGAHAA